MGVAAILVFRNDWLFQGGAKLDRRDHLESARSWVWQQSFEILDVGIQTPFTQPAGGVIGDRFIGGRSGVMRFGRHALHISPDVRGLWNIAGFRFPVAFRFRPMLRETPNGPLSRREAGGEQDSRKIFHDAED